MGLHALKFGPDGLLTVVVQDRLTGELRMVAHANEPALQQTLDTGEGWFWSRSRGALWRKGESSRHVLRVHEVWTDCDGDAVVYLVDPEGRDVHRHEHAAHLVGCCLPGLLVVVGAHHPGALLREPPRRREPDAAARSGHHGHPVGKALGHDSSVAMKTFLTSVKASSASGPSSRPRPDCLNPPNGVQ
jgi:phosphoribosyl-AMP cyclohydrolase